MKIGCLLTSTCQHTCLYNMCVNMNLRTMVLMHAWALCMSMFDWHVCLVVFICSVFLCANWPFAHAWQQVCLLGVCACTCKCVCVWVFTIWSNIQSQLLVALSGSASLHSSPGYLVPVRNRIPVVPGKVWMVVIGKKQLLLVTAFNYLNCTVAIHKNH